MATPRQREDRPGASHAKRSFLAVFRPILLLWGIAFLCLAALNFEGYQAYTHSLEWWVNGP